MSITKNQVIEALKTVEDPDLKKNLVALNMIKDIEIDGNKLSFTIELTTPACPLKELIKQNCIEAINKISDEAIEIKITITSKVTTTRNNSSILPNIKNIIAIASGKGGVGKSTVTINLAVALAKSGASTGIVDADIFGPSMPVMLNCEYEKPGTVQIDGKNYIVPIEQYGVKMISMGLLTPKESAIVWRGPMAGSAIKQLLGDTQWGKLDYMLIDLPPGTSDIHLTLVQSVPVTGAIIVTTPQKVALDDARKGLAMFKQKQINVPVLGIIENMAYFTPEELPNHKYFIFGENGGKKLSEETGVPLLGQIPLVQSIREAGDNGFPSVMKDDITADSFHKLAKIAASKIAIRNAKLEKTKKVEINHTTH